MGKEGGHRGAEAASGSVVKAYLIGHSARDFALQIGEVPHEICETMERAVARAAAEARGGRGRAAGPGGGEFRPVSELREAGRGFHGAGAGGSGR